MKKTTFYCVAVFFLAIAFTLSGCSSGGDDIAFDGPVTDVVGMQFTEENMEEAAFIGINPLLLFYDLSKVITAIIEEVEGQGAPDVGNVQLGDVLCGGQGTAALLWTGVRDQGSVVLVFENCDIDDGRISGEIVFSNTLYNDLEEGNETLTAQVTIGLTVQEELDGEIVDLNINGGFLLDMFRTSNETTKLGFRYGGALDPGALLELTDGDDKLQLGCFDASVSFDPEAPEGTFLLGDKSISRVGGVVIANEQLLTVTGPEGHPSDLASLVFENGLPVASAATSGNPGSAGIDYWGFVLGDGCAVLGVPEGVGQGGTANMTLRIVGPPPPSVVIELFPDGFGQPPSVPPLTIPWHIFIED